MGEKDGKPCVTIMTWLFDILKKKFRKDHLPFKKIFYSSKPECSNVKANVHITCIHSPSQLSLLMGICSKLPLTQNFFNFPRWFELSGVDCTHPLYSQWNLLAY